MKILLSMVEGIGNMVMLLPTIQVLHEMGHEVHLFGRKLPMEIVPDALVASKIDCELKGLQARMPLIGTFDLRAESVWGTSGALKWLIVDEVWKPRLTLDRHEADMNFDLVRYLGYTGEMPLPRVAYTEAHNVFERYSGLNTGLVDTYTSEYWARKSWPFFHLISNRLHTPYNLEHEDTNGVFWFGDGFDRQRIMKARAAGHCYAGELSLKQTAGMILLMDIVIANDSGLAHIAGALGVKTIVLFGSTLKTKNAPLGENVRVLETKVDCAPCQYTSRWSTCGDWVCMSSITVDDVIEFANQEFDGIFKYKSKT